MSLPQNIPDSGSPVPIMNENAASQAWTFCYANDPNVNDLLHRGYSGGRWGGFDVPDYDHTFGASTTTYVCADVTDGTLDFSTSNTNFNDTTDFKRVETVVTDGTQITTVADFRGGPGGVHGSGGGAGGGASRIGLAFEKEFALSDHKTTALTADTNLGSWRPTFDATSVAYQISVDAASSSGSVIVDQNKNGSTMASSVKAEIQATEFDSLTGVQPTMTTTTFSAGDLINWDIDSAGTGAKGLIVTVTGIYAS